MKIQINEKESSDSTFKRGQLLAGHKGGIYLCTKDQSYDTVNVTVIRPETNYEVSGYIMADCYIDNFKLFNGEITLSND